MTEKELRRMGRRELMEIIAAMKKTEMELQGRLEKMGEQLADRKIRIADCGSIAEAALSLNGVFEAAQAAADSYILSVKAANEDLEARREQAEQEIQARLVAIDQQCAEKIAAAEAEIAQKWADFQKKTEALSPEAVQEEPTTP